MSVEPAHSQHSMVGKTLGNYVVRSLLGAGGMGAVFAAEHRFLGHRAAIKVLHGSYTGNEVATQRFFQEARSTREIDHPNVVKILDFGQSEDGQIYLVMEMLEGHNLTDALKDGPLPEREVARIIAAVADGLAAAHDKGIVHRDLKPDNLFLVKTGAKESVKVLDFGIAKVLSSGGQTGSSTIGTPKYMAPEQANGGSQVGPATDIYSLGVILFQMLTGRIPFEGTEMVEILMKTFTEPPPRPSELAPVSPEMEAIVLQCLEKDPSARVGSMAELHDRLLALAGKEAAPGDATIAEGSQPKTIPPLRPRTIPPRPINTPQPSTPTLNPVATDVPPPAPARRGSTVMFAVGAVLVIVVSGGIAISRQRAAAPLPPAPAPAPVNIAPPIAPPPLPAPAPAPAPVNNAPVKVVLRTEPEGASVIIGDKPAGVTPTILTISLPEKVTFTLAGYKTLNEVVSAAGESKYVLIAEPQPAPVQPKKLPAKGGKPAKGAHKAPDDVSLD